MPVATPITLPLTPAQLCRPRCVAYRDRDRIGTRRSVALPAAAPVPCLFPAVLRQLLLWLREVRLRGRGISISVLLTPSYAPSVLPPSRLADGLLDHC